MHPLNLQDAVIMACGHIESEKEKKRRIGAKTAKVDELARTSPAPPERAPYFPPRAD
jgi:hypothetical protein